MKVSKLIIESIINNNQYRQRTEVLIIKDKKILVTIIPKWANISKDYFGFPGGGLEPGETYIDAIKRECLEEVGIQIKNIRKINVKPKIFLWNKDYKKRFNETHRFGSRVQQFNGTQTIYFLADYQNTNMSLYGTDDDQLKYEFISIDEAINRMDYLRKNFEAIEQRPIFQARFDILHKIQNEISND